MTDKKTLNIEEIKKLNRPHRYPFLLIDKLQDIEPNVSATGIKNALLTNLFFKVILNQTLKIRH